MTSTGCWHAISSVRSILRSLYHRRQLKLLVVRIVALVSIVALSVSEDLLIQLDDLVSLVAVAIVSHLMIPVSLMCSSRLWRAI